MFIEANKLWVQASQFDSRLVSRKLPVDLVGTNISVAFPGGDLVRKALPVVDPARQTLPSEYAQFAFGHVQPTSVLRGEVDVQPFRQSPSFAGSERFIERRGRMRIQVVHDQYDPIYGLVLFVQEIPQREGPIDAGPPLGHANMAVSAQGLAEHEDVACAQSLVFRVKPQRLTRKHRQRLANFAHELFAGFIHANYGNSRVVGAAVNVEDIFHPPDEFRIVLFRKAPLLFEPRLNDVF